MSADNIVHEAAKKARKRLRGMAAPTSEQMKDLGGFLQWWSMKESKLPTITKLAYKYPLPVQATSVSSERIFSAAVTEIQQNATP